MEAPFFGLSVSSLTESGDSTDRNKEHLITV